MCYLNVQIRNGCFNMCYIYEGSVSNCNAKMMTFVFLCVSLRAYDFVYIFRQFTTNSVSIGRAQFFLFYFSFSLTLLRYIKHIHMYASCTRPPGHTRFFAYV